MIQTFQIKSAGLMMGALFFMASCSTNKYAATNKIYKDQATGFAEIIKSTPPVKQSKETLDPTMQDWIGSVNFGMRRPNFVILHHTAQDSLNQTVKTFLNKKAEVSAHYVIGRDGKVVQMVNEYLRSNHAGVGKWGNDTDLNSSSIGIELDNNGKEKFADAQINSLVTLLGVLKKKYNIPAANFIGHSDVAPRRKVDPLNFPWKVLAKKGFGLWYDEVLKMPPVDFNTELALRAIGYNVTNVSSAIVAFKIHFVQTDITPVLTPADKLILFNLYTKYL
ncbi:N-acetylmuramoyl-L-alanine amidase [Pedobacter sp. PACM 27299]|uniref:N-acetylmuramoyl-L-alanine amidase n=1 Tax=Pedobacter sp. PACM 27299 TaxID=1727164 RepID=UPI000705742E|nr:N-acetylmuramoyl-L-alanine amidase [Pedobacter sp. PACM 27299]ALL08606.1 N-acetylmuramoyl-L-alanine amidase [Pedobacter sp. PACM 27299]